MGWTKVLLSGDAAELGTASPQAVATAASAGSATSASKEDHAHDIGVGAIDASNLFAASVVDNAAMADDAIGAAEIDGTATNIAFAQIILTPTASGAGTTEGSLFYDSDDDHLYVYVV